MKLIYNRIFLEHDVGIHPESKRRLQSCGKLKETKIENGEKYLELVHSKKYIDRVKKACRLENYLDSNTIVSKKTYKTAVSAVGATVQASKSNDFALVRPPGHHAFPDHSSGFCIFNNISIAVQKLVDEGKKVLIFDFDSHLGDGTSKYFYESNKVLYWSLHQFPAFPYRGDVDEIGEGNGKGFTVNVPLSPGSGDDIYLEAVKRLLPVARQFKPDLVAVSAGFDGHQSDPLLELRLSMNIFYELGKILSKNFENVFATLEGGYNLEFFPKCLFNFVDGIHGTRQRFKEEKTDSRIITIENFESRIYSLEKNLERFWKL